LDNVLEGLCLYETEYNVHINIIGGFKEWL
jgi:hypothetical protein